MTPDEYREQHGMDDDGADAVTTAVSDRLGLNEDGTVDDVVLDAVAVHIEDLGGCIWVGVERSDGDRFAFEVVGRMTQEDGLTQTCYMVESSVGSLKERAL